ncbi:hypothetical protein [Nonomuraea endophytica]|uniref:hypothetical protein n=1 Tax=Nonomuraea endophytica TaxID=714136 RepID=UPI0037CC4F4C
MSSEGRRCASPTCRNLLPAGATSRRSYCSGACRMTAWRITTGPTATPRPPAPSPAERDALAQAVRERAEHLAAAAHHIATLTAGDPGRAQALRLLPDQLHELLAAHVAARRADGASWETVGAELGLHQDAARRRYQPHPPADADRDGRDAAHGEGQAVEVVEADPSPTPPPADVALESAAAEQPGPALPYKKDADPVRRRRWFTAAQLADVQVVATGRGDGSHFVIVAGHLLGTVEPHLSGGGRRTGWDARHRGGSLAWHLGTGTKGGGRRAATREAAVTNLISDVHHAWRNHQDRAQRDEILREINSGT